MQPKRFAIVLVFLLSAAIFAGCGEAADSGEGQGEDLTPVEFRLNWTWYPADHSYFVVGEDQGFYEEEGLDVSFEEGTGSSTVMQLIGRGDSDLGYVDAPTMMQGVAEGVPVQSLAVVNQVSPMGAIFKTERGYSSVQDFEGETIVLTQGDALSQVFPAVLNANDMSADDVEITSTSSPAAKETALLNDQADVLLAFYTEQAPRLEDTQGVDLEWISFADAGVNTFNMSVIANNFWLEENAETAEAFARATQRAIEYTAEDPEEAAEIFVENHDGFSEELALAQIQASIPLLHTEASEEMPYGATVEGDWEEMQQVMVEYADLEPQDDLSTYYTNGFVE